MRCLTTALTFLLIICIVASLGPVQVESQGLSPSSYTFQILGTIVSVPVRVGVYTSSYNFAEFSAGTIAASFDMSQSYYIPAGYAQYDSKVSQVHASNSGYKFLLYRNCMSIQDATELAYAKSQGWILKDTNGNYVTEANGDTLFGVDITNLAYQRWLGSTLATWLSEHPSFDGIYADAILKYSALIFDSGFSSRPLNPGTGAYFTDVQILDGCVGTLNAVIDAVGVGKLVMPNGVWNGQVWSSGLGDNYRYMLSGVSRLNGLCSEGTFHGYDNQWVSEVNWRASVDFVGWVQDNFLAGHPGRVFSAGCVASTLPSGASVEQVMKFGFASMLLAVKYSSPQNTIDFMLDYSRNSTFLGLAQVLHGVVLNSPLGGYYQVSSTSVYARDFVNGRVLVNPSGSSYLVSLSGVYSTLEGQNVSGTITVAPHTGTILYTQ